MRTYTVTSGKGGVGKTSLSINLAISFAKMGYRVVVFDADMALANLDVMAGVRPEFTLQHVLNGEKQLSEIIAEGPGGIGILAGASAIGTLMHSGPKRLGKFLEQLAQLEESTDILIFDTGAGLDSRVTTFMKAADEVLLVTTPDPTSVTDAYATAKVLFKAKPEAVVKVVVNMTANATEGEAVFNALFGIAESFLKRPLIFAGIVRQDADAAKAVRKRKPFAIDNPMSKAAIDVEAVAITLQRDWSSSHSASLVGRLWEESREQEAAAS